MSSKTEVYIIADDSDVRESLGLLLKEGFDVRLHDSAQSFLDAITPHPPGREHYVNRPVIFITAQAENPLAIHAMRGGVIDLFEKPFDDEALLAALGRAVIRSDLDDTEHSEAEAILARLATLTRRESDVFAGLLKGQSNKIIAHELGISKKTVEVHRANLMAKMDARSLAELLRMGLTAERQGRR
jgi:two-component system response regulator FixJ